MRALPIIYAAYTHVKSQPIRIATLEKGSWDLAQAGAEIFGHKKTLVHIDTTSETNPAIELLILTSEKPSEERVKQITDEVILHVWGTEEEL